MIVRKGEVRSEHTLCHGVKNEEARKPMRAQETHACAGAWPCAGRSNNSKNQFINKNITSTCTTLTMVHTMPTSSPPSLEATQERRDNQDEEAGVLRKQIHSLHDIDSFQTSPSYHAFLVFILELNEAAIGKPLSFDCSMSPVCTPNREHH